MDGSAATDFLVDRHDLSKTRWAQAACRPMMPGEAVLALRRFALTANNFTYARTGDRLGFWRYFPGPPGWGRIPVWGIAEVVEPGQSGLHAGEHVYGFMPISTGFSLRPIDLKATTFVDGAAHRSDLPRTYNEYTRLGASPPEADLHLVLRPLFSLSFFLAAFLRDNDFFGARQVVVASASSKTALGLAFLVMRERPASLKLLGLTGAKHVEALATLGRYDRALAYESLPTIPAEHSVFIDIAGDPKVTAAVHRHLGSRLLRSIAVGMTRGGGDADASLPGPTPEFFFTPTHILERRETWGVEVLQSRLAEAWASFREEIGHSLGIRVDEGVDSIEPVYRDVLGGRVPPTRAHVIALR